MNLIVSCKEKAEEDFRFFLVWFFFYCPFKKRKKSVRARIFFKPSECQRKLNLSKKTYAHLSS